MRKMTILLASCMMLGASSCTTWHQEVPTECQKFAPALDASAFISHLRSRGELPGIAKDTPPYGDLFYGSFFTKDPPAPAYPQDHFFFIASPEKNAEYLMYTIRKETETSDWSLVRAWVTDRTGKEIRVLKEAK